MDTFFNTHFQLVLFWQYIHRYKPYCWNIRCHLMKTLEVARGKHINPWFKELSLFSTWYWGLWQLPHLYYFTFVYVDLLYAASFLRNLCALPIFWKCGLLQLFEFCLCSQYNNIFFFFLWNRYCVIYIIVMKSYMVCVLLKMQPPQSVYIFPIMSVKYYFLFSV